MGRKRMIKCKWFTSLHTMLGMYSMDGLNSFHIDMMDLRNIKI